MCVCVYVGYTLGMAGVLGASIVQGEVLMLLSVTRKGSRWPNHSRTVSISHGHYNTYSLDARENLAQVFSVFFVLFLFFVFFPHQVIILIVWRVNFPFKNVWEKSLFN